MINKEVSSTIHNKITFATRVFRTLPVLLVSFLLLFFKANLKTGLIVTLISGFYFFVVIRYFELLSFNGEELKIVYVQWFKEHIRILNISKSEVKIEKKLVIRVLFGSH